MALQTPVLLLAFSRPDTTRRVLERIRDAAPVRFYVACDAARNGRPAEAEKVEAVRALITELVDWPCEVRTLYRDQNLGCKLAVSGALDWFFAHEEMGIILEDDCLPDPSFFGYCESLLHRFKDDERIFMISGNNFQRGEKVTEYSYYYSWLTHIWGWASWRRSWQKVDLEMKNWPAFLAAGGVKQIYPKLRYARRWEKTFERYLQGRYNTWDYPLLFASWWHRQLTVLPEVNLVSNIGFGEEGTHMAAGDNNHLGNLSSAPIGKLRHNTVKQANILADYRSMDFIYPRPIQVVLRKLKAFFGN